MLHWLIPLPQYRTSVLYYSTHDSFSQGEFRFKHAYVGAMFYDMVIHLPEGGNYREGRNRMKQKPKKPIFKRWWFWVIIVAVVVAAFGGSDSDTKDPAADSSPDAVVSAAPDPTPSPTQQPEGPEESNNQTESPIPPVESDVPPKDSEHMLDLDTVMAIWRISLAQNFGENNYTLEYDDTSATINLWADNVAMGAILAASGDENSKKAWITLVDSQKSLCNNIVEQIEDTGAENYYVMINVLNDVDKSKTLLSVLNGVVIYDAVNG